MASTSREMLNALSKKNKDRVFIWDGAKCTSSWDILLYSWIYHIPLTTYLVQTKYMPS